MGCKNRMLSTIHRAFMPEGKEDNWLLCLWKQVEIAEHLVKQTENMSLAYFFQSVHLWVKSKSKSAGVCGNLSIHGNQREELKNSFEGVWHRQQSNSDIQLPNLSPYSLTSQNTT